MNTSTTSSQTGSTQVPAAIAKAAEAFDRDLPSLVQEHSGKWAAYRAEGRIALGDSKRVIYRQCLDLGYAEDEFIVRRIAPRSVDEIEVLYDV